ncbi:HPP family protein [Pseudoclavibacter helvolus]|uniref:CBS domain-containing protein n=1 Tax=Pseudoclavibacter helvolus TaxID=255205 RepID=UPI001428C62F|nr:CBS domain-containing protein [Pseudoclavibacter helvolus]
MTLTTSAYASGCGGKAIGPGAPRVFARCLGSVSGRTFDSAQTVKWFVSALSLLLVNKTREPGSDLTIAYLPSATVEPVFSVNESDSVATARTLMELHDFSQLPVLHGRRPVGAVTWESIGKALLNDVNAQLRNCIDREAPTVKITDELLDVIPKINESGYALVLGPDRTLSGIVTSADLGVALDQLARPFLLIERLEFRLRALLNWATQRDLADRTIDTDGEPDRAPDEHTLGELVTALNRLDVWRRADAFFDPKLMQEQVGRVVALRNQLMHFRPLEKAEADTLAVLPQLVRMTDRVIATVGAGRIAASLEESAEIPTAKSSHPKSPPERN